MLVPMLIPASGVMLLAMLVAPRYGICREQSDWGCFHIPTDGHTSLASTASKGASCSFLEERLRNQGFRPFR